MQRFPAAERLASDMTLEAGDTVDLALSAWEAIYRGRVGAPPSTEEADAARRVIDKRLAGELPPLPPSASSSGWKIPVLTLGGVPKTVA